MKKNKTLSIIIIAYNEEKYISGILNSLTNQTIKDFEVIVVDSNSIDNTEIVAKSFSKNFNAFRYLKLDVTKGPGYGRNQGEKIANYEKLLFLDADTKLNNNFVERIVIELIKRKIEVATCPIRIAEKNPISNIGAYFLNSFMILLKPVYSSAYGACFISTKEVHSKVNGFDENIAICEDCNYIKKARRLHNINFGILKPYFYTSDRRAKSYGGLTFMLMYVKLHLYRMFTGQEIMKGKIEYNYGNF